MEEKVPQKPKKSKSIGKIIAIIFGVLVFVACLLMAFYPMISEYVYNMKKSSVRTEYKEAVEEIDTSERDKMWADAKEYNDMLANLNGYTSENVEEISGNYRNLLNPEGRGIMCYVEIPIIDVYLATYHGDTPGALEKGVEHLYGTSLPVGGESTHSVLSAHSGKNEKLFTDLPELQLGDVFYLHTLDQTLAYRVDNIATVLPHDVSKITIEDGEDQVTLITCVPYAVNTHRLLVRGSRIPYEAAKEAEVIAEEEHEVKSVWTEYWLKGLLMGLAALAVVVIIVVIIRVIVKKAKKAKKCEKDGEK